MKAISYILATLSGLLAYVTNAVGQTLTEAVTASHGMTHSVSDHGMLNTTGGVMLVIFILLIGYILWEFPKQLQRERDLFTQESKEERKLFEGALDELRQSMTEIRCTFADALKLQQDEFEERQKTLLTQIQSELTMIIKCFVDDNKIHNY